MNFTINRSAFISQLNNVLRAISSKTTIPILTGLKMVVNEDNIVLTGSNSDITIESVINANDADNDLTIEDTGAIVLPARFFSDIVKKLPDKKVTIEVTSGFQADITSGSAKFQINGQDAENFPHLPEIETNKSVTLPNDILKEVIRQTVIAVSKQESRPILAGVHMTLKDGILTAVATDSHRLAQRKVVLENIDNGIDFDVIIPGKSMEELSGMISDVHEDVQMQVTENQVLFIFGNTHFYSRLLEGNYPETSQLIPQTADTTVELEAGTFLSSIERASLLSHESRNDVVKLSLKPSENLVRISGDSPDIGTVEEEVVTSALDGNDLEISFNPNYMKDALRSFGQATIKISFTSPLRPFTLVPTEDQENFVHLITPVRTF
ncbi:DNA polymerase III subunit beta [Limosilactobacillus reuteri]|jgi:DNA polymerase III, beta subunit|uniref:Beta sliding clamp n=4 Tax=Limosilactobacillus reuteri TaxID=1598 RepID=A0A073JQE0_LIMRT|nr:DNA polymerase III subunit beta [Limosilactobacillus reuteri]AGR63511.1 DNA polymerase III subunit beta [Limosilactobacillus reuteri TD1]ANU52220.1 DNA polymerase III subunit beta [Limosilactobacillus reuteri]EDX43337.1 DNA polymerase III, beta subunit [Limosilactobacillus reuteri subsp. rodentium]KEK15650.1 DNA polymerase III subunit beta [Limosilactobacillus reuteri]MCC4358288.1 DNA polymerase III subunit beta [Limosilactobacillus reuteri]